MRRLSPLFLLERYRDDIRYGTWLQGEVFHFDENEDFIVYRSFEGTFADIQKKAKHESSFAKAAEEIQKKFSMDDIQNIIIGMEQYGYSHNGEGSTELENNQAKKKIYVLQCFETK